MLNSISSDYSSLAGQALMNSGTGRFENQAQSLSIGRGAVRVPGSKAGEKEKLQSLCKDFESIFVHQMLKAMRQTVNKEDSLIDGGMGEEIFQDMLDGEYAKEASRKNSLGLADMLFKQLSKTLG